MKLLSALMFVSLLSGCASVPPGHVVLAVDLSTSDDATRYSIIHGGRYWPALSPNNDYYEIPVMEQRQVWTQTPSEGNPVDESISFAGKDGQAVNVDLGVGYQLEGDDKSIEDMVRKYGPVLHTTIDGRVRDSVRNSLNLCASEFTVEQIYGEQKGTVMDCALKRVNDEYSPFGLSITRLTLNSAVRLPAVVQTAMEAANAAVQNANQVQNEVATAKAQAEKDVAQAQGEADSITVRAKAQAEANRLLAESITPGLIELKRIEVQQTQADKWSGILPTTVLGDSVPMLDLSQGK